MALLCRSEKTRPDGQLFTEENRNFRSFCRRLYLIRLLSKQRYSEEFLEVIGAQDRSILVVQEDPSTGATTKLPKKREFRQKSIPFCDFFRSCRNFFHWPVLCSIFMSFFTLVNEASALYSSYSSGYGYAGNYGFYGNTNRQSASSKKGARKVPTSNISKMIVDPTGTYIAYIKRGQKVDEVHIIAVNVIDNDTDYDDTDDLAIFSKERNPNRKFQPIISDIEFVSNQILAIVTKDHLGKLTLLFVDIRSKILYEPPNFSKKKEVNKIIFLKENSPQYYPTTKILMPDFIIMLIGKNSTDYFRVKISRINGKLVFFSTPLVKVPPSLIFYSPSGFHPILMYFKNRKGKNIFVDVYYYKIKKYIERNINLSKKRYISANYDYAYKLELDNGQVLLVKRDLRSGQEVGSKLPNVTNMEDCEITVNKYSDPLFITTKNKSGSIKHISLTSCKITESKKNKEKKTISDDIIIMNQRSNSAHSVKVDPDQQDSMASHMPRRYPCEDAVSVASDITAINKHFTGKNWTRISATLSGKVWLLFVKNSGYYLYRPATQEYILICKTLITNTNAQNSSIYSSQSPYYNNSYFY
jgi:hypothetical protein